VDPALAEHYRPIAEKRNEELILDSDLTASQKRQALDLGKMRQERYAFELNRMKELFPFELELKKEGLSHAQLANKLAEARVELIPLQKSIMENRNELGKLDRKYYTEKMRFQQSMTSFHAQVAWGSYIQSGEAFQRQNDQFTYSRWKDDQARASDSLEAEYQANKAELSRASARRKELTEIAPELMTPDEKKELALIKTQITGLESSMKSNRIRYQLLQGQQGPTQTDFQGRPPLAEPPLKGRIGIGPMPTPQTGGNKPVNPPPPRGSYPTGR
jgi:hypothetical protein